MILIATGGIGSTIDDLALNIQNCHYHGVQVKGIILNKVIEEKRQTVTDYVSRFLAKQHIPLLGTIPYTPFLHMPCMNDFELLFQTALLSGGESGLSHFRTTRLVAGSLDSYLEESTGSERVITPACREDIIFALIKKQGNHLPQQYSPTSPIDEGRGIILTGKTAPREWVCQALKASHIPALYAPLCSFEVMKRITTFTAKIGKHDRVKIEKAIALIKAGVECSRLIS